MFKWWKKRKDLKKLKAIKELLINSVEALDTVRHKTIIGDLTNLKACTTSTTISCVNIPQIIIHIEAIMNQIDIEVDDRTREREPLFKKVEDNAL